MVCCIDKCNNRAYKLKIIFGNYYSFCKHHGIKDLKTLWFFDKLYIILHTYISICYVINAGMNGSIMVIQNIIFHALDVEQILVWKGDKNWLKK